MSIKTTYQSQHGFGLIEVMISVLIVGTALLTLTSLQSKSLQFNQNAYLRSQANILAYDVIDRIRINQKQAASYDILFSATEPSGSSRRDVDLKEWLTNLSTNLPSGDGQIDCDGNPLICNVDVSWTEQSGANNNDNITQTLSYTVQI